MLFTALHGATLALLLRDVSSDVRLAGIATLVWTPAFIALLFGLAALQGGLRLDAYNALRPLPATLYAGAAVVLWVAGIHTLEALAAAFALAYLMAALLVLSAVRATPRTATVARDPVDLASVRRFGRRSLLGWFVPLEAFRVDQAAVGLLVSPSALGLYVVAVAFTNLPRFVGQSIGSVAYPLIARLSDREAARRDVARVLAIGSVVIVALVLVVEAAVGWLVPLLFGSEFESAVPLARVLLPAGGLVAIRHIITDAARGAGSATAGSLSEVAGWAVFGSGLLLLVPRYEAMGVALAMLAAAAVSLAACIWIWLASTRHQASVSVEAVAR